MRLISLSALSAAMFACGPAYAIMVPIAVAPSASANLAALAEANSAFMIWSAQGAGLIALAALGLCVGWLAAKRLRRPSVTG